MAEKDIPTYRCTCCLQAIPADQDQHLFGGYGTAPKSDDVHNFVTEAQIIIRYIAAVADMCDEAEQKGADTLSNLHLLLGELADEANRRLERAEVAWNIVWTRTHDVETGLPKEGGA